jgi:CelD/BcsL family acetyltransferase involved in cellulose biosynthesis
MTHVSLTTDRSASAGSLVAVPIAFAAIPRPAWDRLLAATPAATPFSRWTLHAAWWEAYGVTSHEQYLVCVPAGRAADPTADPSAIRAIVPLMHRHVVEPQDAATHTALRRRHDAGTDLRPDAKAVFMAASYHADYATILADPADLPAVAAAIVVNLAGEPDPAHGRSPRPWDVLDLRRWRDDDPALPILEAAFRDAAAANDWEVRREQEDVCPVVTLPADGTWDDYLATLDKKARHEIRRKIRRAEAAGEVRFSQAPLTAETVDRFIALHQARWGADGLFPDTEGGDRSRRFLHRLTELEAAEGPDAMLQLGLVHVGERLIFASAGFDDGRTCYFYNAGMDPDARDLSPGVTGAAAYIGDRLAAGRRRFDFLRGDETYKYEWGAVDEPIHRLIVLRTA